MMYSIRVLLNNRGRAAPLLCLLYFYRRQLSRLLLTTAPAIPAYIYIYKTRLHTGSNTTSVYSKIYIYKRYNGLKNISTIHMRLPGFISAY